MMIHLRLKYLAHISMITGLLEEACQTKAGSFRQLIDELGERYDGFQEVFLEPETGQMKLNAAILYKPKGENPSPVADLDQPIKDDSTITFW